MKTLADRINFRMSEIGLSQEDLAKLVHVSQAAIQKITSGKTLKPRIILELSAALKVSPEWLSYGEQPHPITRSLPAPIIESNAHEAPQLGRFRPIPIVGMAQLGDNGHWSEMEYPVGYGDGYIAFPTADENAYALRCVGDSMRPRIQDGEFVIIEPNTEAIPGDEVLIKALDGRVMVKKLLYQRDGKIHVMSVNEAHPPQSFDQQDVDKMHPVTAIVKKALWVKN